MKFILRQNSGLSIIEAFVAVSMIAGCLLGAFYALNYAGHGRLRSRTRVAVGQYEDIIREEVFARMSNWMIAVRAGCNISAMPPPLTWTTADNISFQLISNANIGPLFEPNPRDFGFNAGLTRCQSSYNYTATPAYLAGRAGVHFCLRIAAAPGFVGGQNDFLTTMQPIYAEFYYVNTDVTAAARTEVLCANQAGRNLFGVLVYSIHWTAAAERIGNLHPFKAGEYIRGVN